MCALAALELETCGEIFETPGRLKFDPLVKYAGYLIQRQKQSWHQLP